MHFKKQRMHYRLIPCLYIMIRQNPNPCLLCISIWTSVLSHTMEGGTERPITHVSHTLSSAEKKYSQLKKEEGLAIIFGC